MTDPRRSPTASPDQDFLKLVDALQAAQRNYDDLTSLRFGPNPASDSSLDAAHNRLRAARQSLVDYLEGIRQAGMIAAIDLASTNRYAEILSAELSDLKEDALTDVEARIVRIFIINGTGAVEDSILEKLWRISSSGGSKE